MKDLYIVANWKENKTEDETNKFFEDFLSTYKARDDAKVIICPPYLSVSQASKIVKINDIKVDIGTQDVSKFEKGAYTGEVSAAQVLEFAKFSIIGHSERRKNFGETDEDIEEKVERAKSVGIEPIVCVINSDVPVPAGVKIVAYEPVESIGTGNPDTPENAREVAKKIKEKNSGVEYVLYGGSVTAQNVRNFTEMPDINGILVGGASLDASSFSELVKNA